MFLPRSSVLALVAGLVLVPAGPSGAAPAPATCEGEIATIVGTSGDDVLTGTEGPDVVSLGAGNDVFDGVGGDDLVCTSSGMDLVHLGAGNDRVYGDGVPGDDEIHTGGGDDQVLVNGGLIFTGTGNDNVGVFYGGASVHTGPGTDNAEIAGFGRVWLGDGADHGYVVQGNPVVEGGEGDDEFLLWAGGDPDADVSSRGARVIGGDGRDSLHWFMNWPMRLDARTGRVTSKGSVFGPGSENDTEATFRGIEGFVGSPLDDVMIGHSGRDHFRGGHGNDLLIGRGGRDVLVGGLGRDKATGGAGVDTCRAERRQGCERR